MHHRAMRTLLVLTVALGGCATSQPTLGPVALYRVAPDGVGLEEIDQIMLPKRAELTIRPKWFVGALASDVAPGEEVRLQVQLRFHRTDGLEKRIFLTGDNSDPAGHSERVGPARADGRASKSLAGRKYGPIRAYDLVALEALVAQVAPEATGGNAGVGGPVGVMALRAAPPLKCLDASLLARAEAPVAVAGAFLELAARIPIKQVAAKKAQMVDHHYILVEAEPAGTSEGVLATVARLLPSAESGVAPLADKAGRVIRGLSAFSFVLQVGERPPTRPKKDEGHDPKDERLNKPVKVGMRPYPR